MKKLLLFFLFTSLGYTAFANAVVNQKGWRWIKDDGGESSATELASNMIYIDREGANLRLRIAFTQESNSPFDLDADPRLSYSMSPAGPFTKISADELENDFVLSSSSLIQSGTQTTQQLTVGDPLQFNAGVVVGEGYNNQLVFSNSSHVTEHEWIIRPTSHAKEGTYYFKLENLGGTYVDGLPALTYCINNQLVTVDETSVCAGSSTTFRIGSSDVGMNYWLRDDSDNSDVAGPIAGSGNALEFNSGTFSAPKTFHIYAENATDANCSLILANKYTLTIVEVANQVVSPALIENVPPGNQVFSLASSENGVVYSLRNDANQAILQSLDGTGNALEFSVQVNSTTTFNVLAQKPREMQRNGFALEFDGVDDYVEVEGAHSQFGLHDFAIEAWINTTDVNQTIVAKTNDNSTWEEGEKVFYLDGLGMPAFIGFSEGQITSNLIVNDGTWHHIAVSFNHADQVGKIYVDGIDRTAVSDFTGETEDIEGLLKIGASLTGEADFGNFSGQIDEVRIWSTSRTIAQISYGMNRSLVGRESGLVHYFVFEDGEDSEVLTDLRRETPANLINMDATVAWTSGFGTVEPCAVEMSVKPLVTLIPTGGVDPAPTGLVLSSNTIRENQPAGTFIGRLTTEYIRTGETFTYELVPGEGSANNNLFYIQEDGLYSSQPLDYEAQRTHTIRVSTTHSGGGSFARAFIIEVVDLEEVRIYIPNLFSPNGDGSNDVFRVRSSDVQQITFRVFNRLGTLLYETSNPVQALEVGWDGTFKGKEMPAGTYIWQVSGIFTDGTLITVDGKNTGNITLVR